MDLITKLASGCRVATAHDVVINSECVFTFHTPYTTERGIVVNLSSFVGSTDELALTCCEDDATGPRLFVRIVKKRVEKEVDAIDTEQESETEPSKLGVGVEGGFQSEQDKYETKSSYSIVAIDKDGSVVADLPYNDATKNEFPLNVAQSAESIIHHAGLSVKQDLTAWELDDEPKPVSKYAESLPFEDNGVKVSPNPSDWKCEKSGATDNLWLNLSDGFIGGGRKNWDGSGGSNGALDHFVDTGEKYPLVVKLGYVYCVLI